jgi:hypothetical protein
MNPLHTRLVPILIVGTLGLAALAGAGLMSPAAAQTKAIQSQDTNVDGVVAEITQAQRKDGVLTIRLRVRNTSDSVKEIRFPSGSGEFDRYYVVAGNRKYLILRDSKGVSIASPDMGQTQLQKGGGYTWWAKFPAPPASETKFGFFTAIAPPFEDVPISD